MAVLWNKMKVQKSAWRFFHTKQQPLNSWKENKNVKSNCSLMFLTGWTVWPKMSHTKKMKTPSDEELVMLELLILQFVNDLCSKWIFFWFSKDFLSVKSNCGFCSSRISAADFHGENLTESTFHNFFLKFVITNLRIRIVYDLSSQKNMKQD